VSKRQKAKRDHIEGKLPDVVGWLKEFNAESERASAVLGAAYVDARLEALLRALMVDCSDLQESLLGINQPLSAFGARIKLAFALGLLTPWEFHDLQAIQDIRNAFAHQLHGRSFANPDIAARCADLKMPKFLIDYLAEDEAPPRNLFQLSVISIAVGLREREKAIERLKPQPEHEWKLLSPPPPEEGRRNGS
jgi:hypothetical protein